VSASSLSAPVHEERLMNTYEASILMAFLNLFKWVRCGMRAAGVRRSGAGQVDQKPAPCTG